MFTQRFPGIHLPPIPMFTQGKPLGFDNSHMDLDVGFPLLSDGQAVPAGPADAHFGSRNHEEGSVTF